MDTLNAPDSPQSAGDSASAGIGGSTVGTSTAVVEPDEQGTPDAANTCGGPGIEPAQPKDPRITRTRWVAAVLVALAMVGAGFAGWKLYQRHERDVAAAQALAAAEKYVVTLTSIDSNDIDQNVADILAGSTGEFNAKYAQTSGQLRQLIIDNKTTARGKVVESAVKSVSPNKVKVLLMVDQSVSSLASPEVQIDRSRIKMTMEKIDGRWLVSKVELL